jgi:long-chain acyl-CoA synthetase
LRLVTGDTVAALLPNGPEYLAAYFAAVEEGLYFTPINYHLLADEVAYIAGDSLAKVLVTCAEFGSIATAAADKAELPARARITTDELPGFNRLPPLRDGAGPIDQPADRPVGTVMIFTSGTTGRPKGSSGHLRTWPTWHRQWRWTGSSWAIHR